MTMFEMNGFGCGCDVGTSCGDGYGADSFGDGDYVGHGDGCGDACGCYGCEYSGVFSDGSGDGYGVDDSLVYYGGAA